jgi:hypothetical protein
MQQLKLPNQCFDRIKGAIFFPRSMVATSHKQQFGLNEKLLEYLYREPKELDQSTAGGKKMADQYKKLRTNFRKVLQTWHNFDAEVHHTFRFALVPGSKHAQETWPDDFDGMRFARAVVCVCARTCGGVCVCLRVGYTARPQGGDGGSKANRIVLLRSRPVP